jgi:hypothetical protein
LGILLTPIGLTWERHRFSGRFTVGAGFLSFVLDRLSLALGWLAAISCRSEVAPLPRALMEAFCRTNDFYRDWMGLLRFLSPLTVPGRPLIEIL